MSKYIQQTIFILLILMISSCSNSKKLVSQKGFFGINFGSTFHKKNNTPTTKFINELMYEIDPPKKLKYFDKYYVAITPKTNKIYAIYAVKKYKDFLKTIDDYDEINDILIAKYGKGKYSKGSSSYFFKGGFLTIYADSTYTADGILSFYSKNLKYEDIANKEKIKLVKNKDAL